MADKTGAPFRVLERVASEIDSVFDSFGVGRSWFASRGTRNWLRNSSQLGAQMWAPQIDVDQQSDEFIVRADLPGLKSEDVTIDVTEDEITISGERRHEQSFCRIIPIPDGAITDRATATFVNGVLEIRMPAPPDQVRRGRRLEIKETGR